MKEKRLDEVLIAQKRTVDKKEAFIIVTEGRVFVNGQKAVSPAQMISADDHIEVRGGREYVGRGAYKLEAALKQFGVSPERKICADIGSATGGFVEVLLKYGAKKVYAIDTARGKLDMKLRSDSRVAVMEGTDVRGLRALPEEVEMVTADVSLISLREILPAVRRIAQRAEAVVLFKPQYETRDKSILRHGIIEDGVARQRLVDEFKIWAEADDWKIIGVMESPIRGGEGNVEYLFYLKSDERSSPIG